MFAVIISGLKISFNSKIMAPAVAGIKRLNEKLKALIGESPNKSPEKMVRPERETPGRIAIDWKIPIIKEIK